MIFWFFLLFFGLFVQIQASPVTNYKVISMRGIFQGLPHYVMRKFHQDGQARLLILNSQTAITQVVTANFVSRLAFCKLPYGQTEAMVSAAPSHSLILTMDLCPSSKPFIKDIITHIPDFIPRPVPIGIAISGRWITQHGDDLEWIKRQELEGRIKITWINHSLNHFYNPSVPIRQTFLLTSGIVLKDEILNAEIQMLENGLTPSVFFRCPGLVSDAHVAVALKAFNLISLGANAWLGKGESVVSGSIILVHGTGNEPEGVRRLLRWYGSLKPGAFPVWVAPESLLLPSAVFDK